MGAAAGIATAIFAASTNLILRRQVIEIGGAAAQTWRAAVGTVIFAIIFLIFRTPGDLLALPPRAVAILLASVVLNMVIGDLLQYAAITRLGIALAMPISSSYPLVTLIIASLTLGELPTVRAAIGTVLVIGGIILVALPRRTLEAAGAKQLATPVVGHWSGVILALASAVCFALAAILTRVALLEIDTISANMLRLPFGALLCGAIAVAQRRPPWRATRSNYLPLCLSGLTGLGSSMSFLIAITLVGAATTATLNASAPIFGLFGAVLFLGERPTRRNIVGTIIAFVGVVLVV